MSKKFKTIDRLFSKYSAQIILVLLFIFFSLECKGRFFTADNMITIVRQVTTMGIAALGVSFLMITGNLDFSIGSIYALVGVMTTLLYTAAGMNIYLAMLISFICGTLLSCFTCFVSITFKIPRLVTSLAMNMAMGGVAYLISGSKTLYGLPENIKWLGQGHIWKIPISMIFLVIFALIVSFILKKTFFGRYMFAVGGNPDVARLSGINVNKVNYIASFICGALVSFSGLISMSRTFCGSPSAGGSLSSDVISAAVLGGVSIMGGTGKTSGLMTGVLIMGVLSVGLNMMGMLTNPQQIFKGIMLLLAIILDSRSKRLAASAS